MVQQTIDSTVTKMSPMWLLVFLPVHFVCAELVNEQVDRRVDLHSQITRVETRIVIRNLGPDTIYNYTYLVEGYGSYHVNFDDGSGENMCNIEEKYEVNGRTFRSHFVPYSLGVRPNVDVVLNVTETYPDNVVVLQKKKRFASPELVRYDGNLLFRSVYETRSYSIKYTGKNVQFTSVPTDKVSDDFVAYTRKSVKPFSEENVSLVFEVVAPLLNVERLDRVIDVSHYGMIIVEDSIELVHPGAKLDGPYEPIHTPPTWLHTHLPASADDVRLFDQLGVRYDTSVTDHAAFKSIKFKTRYPMLGGWKSSYVLRYTVPIYEYVRRLTDGSFFLQMRIVDHVISDGVIRNSTTRVVLPENAVAYSVNVPDSFDFSMESTITALVCSGRQTVVIKGADGFEYNLYDFTVKYRYNPINYLHKPLKLAALCYGLFLFGIFVSRAKTFVAI